MSEVETARLLLRRWQDDDLERLVALFADPRVAWLLSVDGRPWPRERTVGVFEHFLHQWGGARLRALGGGRQGQRPLARSDRAERAAQLAWSAEDRGRLGAGPLGVGQGLATEGGRAALGHGFEVVGLERIISVTRADHAASRRVMEKCGLAFQEQLVHKGALVVWYAIDRADWQASQAAASQ
jgi:RimJ/RimL family protein N-acetyltransferase